MDEVQKIAELEERVEQLEDDLQRIIGFVTTQLNINRNLVAEIAKLKAPADKPKPLVFLN